MLLVSNFNAKVLSLRLYNNATKREEEYMDIEPSILSVELQLDYKIHTKWQPFKIYFVFLQTKRIVWQ